MSVVDWVPGDNLGLDIPAHTEALRTGGEAFLTKAFHAAGTLAADNRVARITQFEECPGGSTGRKLLLAVAYEKPAPGLPTDLFVKFSRDFGDKIRDDRGSFQMEGEVRMALLSRAPQFPVVVPKCLFADYQHSTLTGVLVTERIGFGTGIIERAYDKCKDYEVPDALGHYRVLLTAVARLAGTHKSGRLPVNVDEQFPFDPQKASLPIHYTVEQLQRRVARVAEFDAKYPRLLPKNITAPAFLERMSQDIVGFIAHEKAIKRHLASRPDMIALCHWNANIDNAWFWRDEAGELHCGLIDWGMAGQVNLGGAMWGCLSGAEPEMVDEHLDDLLEMVVAEYRRCGGPAITAAGVKLDMQLSLAMGSLAWLMDAPALLLKRAPNLTADATRFDPVFAENEGARTQLRMFTSMLNVWDKTNFSAALDEFLRRSGATREAARATG